MGVICVENIILRSQAGNDPRVEVRWMIAAKSTHQPVAIYLCLLPSLSLRFISFGHTASAEPPLRIWYRST